MKRALAPLMILAFSAVVWAEGPATRPTDAPYTTHEVIPNPEVEEVVKGVPKAAMPKPMETDADRLERRKVTKEWVTPKMKGKRIKVGVVVISESTGAFRVEGMDKTLVLFAAKFPRGVYKLGDRATIEGEFRNLFIDYRDGETQFLFTLNSPQISK